MMAALREQYVSQLGELLDTVDQNLAGIAVAGLQLDSRKVNTGDLFLACLGFAVDGRDFIDHAIDAGAVAVLVEQEGRWKNNSYYRDVPLIVVADLQEKISDIAGRFYGHPSRQLSLVGVTGTNGKTSCCHLLMQLLNTLGQSCGLIGTLGSGVDGQIHSGLNTTPDAVSIQHLLAQWSSQSVARVAMEVSSHGLDQQRVAALQFQQAIFTNLSRDHLDYHETMERYAEAKAALFRQRDLQTAIINIDDAYGEFFVSSVPGAVKTLRYSLLNKDAEVYLEDINYALHGVSAHLHSPWGEGDIHSALSGQFNLSNVLAVVTALCAQGFPFEDVLAAVSELRPVPGRMEMLGRDADIQVVVDYAHTPAALQSALEAMNLHKQGELWCVFGCGGERDRGKRQQMAAIAEQYADKVLVTSDNPRGESASAIIEEICSGFNAAVRVEEDRAAAIQWVINAAETGDSILIAGKGHEDYQQIGDQRLPFSDSKQVRLALAERAGR